MAYHNNDDNFFLNLSLFMDWVNEIGPKYVTSIFNANGQQYKARIISFVAASVCHTNIIEQDNYCIIIHVIKLGNDAVVSLKMFYCSWYSAQISTAGNDNASRRWS